MDNRNLSLSIVWFRIGDLRVHDHEPFHHGCSSDSHVLPFFYGKREREGDQDVVLCSESRKRAIEKALKCLACKIESYGASLVHLESVEDMNDFRKRVVEQIKVTSYKEVRLHYYASINRFIDLQQYDEEQTVLNTLDGLVDSVCLSWGRTLLHPNCILSSDSSSDFTKGITLDSDTRRLRDIDSNGCFMTENFIKHILRLRTMTAFRTDIAKDQVQEPCDMTSAIASMQSPSLFQREMPNTQKYLFKIDSAVEHGNKATTETHDGIFADEDESLKRLNYILTKPGFMEGYQESRMLASTGDNSSMLSTALSVGSLSPRMVYTKAIASLNAKRTGTEGCDWSKELQKNGPGEAWLIMHLVIRDFFIFSSECHGPELLVPDGPAKKSIVWKQDEELFKAWAQGRTGFPYIDANMRQLAATGYISNRGRQNVASFLAKELDIDWRWGAEHFRSTLVDHEPGINLESWAYVSGVGSDPRDRKFLSVTQGERYDPQGTLIARWLPELAQLPASYMHRPWSYPDKGKLNYPDPIVDPANQIGRHV